ncbi:MAG: hypothetical protein LWW93_17330 [Hyphomicrobiales bacterium]|nr:hypothetical protein [Hyphomicrobiales bacterium]
MSIEWAMWFALGFLSSGVLALLVMAAVWRRAVRLTTRRVRATLPVNLDEAQAQTDFLRARHAREGRRLELALADLRRRNAEERVAVGRGRIEIGRLGEDLAAARGKIAEVEAVGVEQAGTIAAREARIDALEAELVAVRGDREALSTALGERGEAIARQIEDHRTALDAARAEREAAIADLVAQHGAAVAALEGDLADLRAELETRATTAVAQETQMRSMRLQLAETSAQLDAEKSARGLAEAAAGQEKDRADRLDRRIGRLVADVADREERAERTARELERARQALVFANARASATAGGGEGTAAAGDNLLRSLAELEARNRELEDRLGAAARGETAADDDPASRAALKDALADLAARIVHLTRVAEGESSPVGRILAAHDGAAGGRPGLADRIRDLERTATDRSRGAEAARV